MAQKLNLAEYLAHVRALLERHYPDLERGESWTSLRIDARRHFDHGDSPARAVSAIARSYRARRRRSTRESDHHYMTQILEFRGFATPAAYARILVREGVGVFELQERLRHAPGSVGSLEYSHNFKRRSTSRDPRRKTRKAGSR